MAQVRKRGDRKYEVIVQLGREDGRRREVSRTFHGTKRAAHLFAQRLEVEMRGRGSRRRDLDAPPPATVAGLLEEWYDYAAPGWSPSTRRQHRSIIDSRIKPSLGKLALERLSVVAVDRFYADLRLHVQPSTVRRIHGVLHRACVQAVRWGWLDANPAADPNLDHIEEAEVEPPSREDVRRLIARAHELAGAGRRDALLAHATAVFLRLAIASGARRGELCALRWEDVDDTGLIIVRALVDAGGGELEVKSTKTRKKRRVSLDPETLVVLEAYRLKQGAAALQTGYRPEWVFERPGFGGPIRPDVMSHRFTRLRDDLGLTFRLHDLRHCNTTWLLAAGIDVRTVAGRLGWSDGGRMALGRYGHRLEASDQAAAEAMGKLLDG